MLILKYLRPKQNSFYLVGDGDELDLVNEIEEFYGLKFVAGELEDAETFGKLFDVVISKRGSRGEELDPGKTWNELAEIVSYFSGFKGLVDRDTTFIASWT